VTCDQFDTIVDDIATGEGTLPAEVGRHLTGCPRCRMTLAVARGVDRWLHDPPPPAPAQFTASVLRRVQRDRWRVEQIVDTLFNGVLGLGAVLVAIGIWLFINSSRTVSFFQGVVATAQRGDWIAPVTPPHALAYVGSMALVITAAAMWWWMDREDAL
jgi:anti-sigma factor RsiW